MPLKFARLIGLATVLLTFGAFLSAGAGASEPTALPGLVKKLPGAIKFAVRPSADCNACRNIALINSSDAAHSASLAIKPYDPPSAIDRSVGEWVFSYSRELGRTESGIAPIVVDSTEPTSSIATTRRFSIRALRLQGEAAVYTPGSFEFVLHIPPGEQRTLCLLYTSDAADE